MKLEQEQAGDREDEASEGEDVDEQAPSAARIAALVEIVEAGNPAAAGDFARCLAGREIDCDPRVAAGARRGEIDLARRPFGLRSDAHTSALQSLMRISYAVFCLKNTNTIIKHHQTL